MIVQLYTVIILTKFHNLMAKSTFIYECRLEPESSPMNAETKQTMQCSARLHLSILRSFVKEVVILTLGIE